MEPPWDVEMKICSNVLGNMTEMASRRIYSENLQKPSSEPKGCRLQGRETRDQWWMSRRQPS